jgi:Ser/Thr protein kinase RdoA (MazF antagonist)
MANGCHPSSSTDWEADPVSEPSPTPYADLTPDRVLDAVESLGYCVDGHLLAMNSYENRVYQIGVDDAEPVIVKFYRPGRWSDPQIIEEHRFSAELASHELPVIAPLRIDGETLHHHAGFRFAIWPRRGGRTPELDDPEVLEWIGRLVGRMHAIGASRQFEYRLGLDIEHFGEQAADLLLDEQWLPPELEDTYEGVVEQALDEVNACFERAGNIRRIRLHGDCHRGNMLWTDAGPHFVDLDDCLSGPAMQDIWMLLAGDRAEMADQLGHVLEGYRAFHDFDTRELHLVEALRTLRQMHHAAWLARRWDDPAFPLAFPWFDTQHYWQDHLLALREQIAAMQEGPLVLAGL